MNAGHELPSGTVTFLFSDVEGSTRLLKRLRDAYAGVLREHQELLRAAFAAHGGHVVDAQGDEFFVVFRRAKDAVSAAVAAQRALDAHTWPEGVELRVRMGVHTGQAEASDGRYHGLAVHRAARIGAAAHGGQVLVSQTTRDLLDDEEEEAAGVELRDLGEQRLKDLDRPVRLYQLVVEGLRSEFPPLRGIAQAADQPRALSARFGRRRLRIALPVAAAVAGGAIAGGLLLTRGSSEPAQASAGVAADSVGVFDARTGEPIAQTPVRPGPSAVAAGLGSIWVANVDDDSVSQIDPQTRASVQTIPAVGNGPAGISVGGRFVWVANSLDGTVSKIDPRADRVVQKIPVGNRPTDIAYGLGAVWVTLSADRALVRLDPGSGKPGKPISIEAGADAVAVGYGAVWVAGGESSGSVARYDPRTGSVQPIDVGSGASAVAVGDGAVWVANFLDDTVSRIDPASNRLQTTITVGAGPSDVAVGQNAVWVSNEQGGTLSRIDPARDAVGDTIETANRPEGVAVFGNAMYVAVRTSGLAHRGGTLVLLSGPRAKFQPTLDPAYLCCDWPMLIYEYDGLTAYRHVGGGEGARLVPDLAASLPKPTDGGRTYVFRLRSGIRYSNGELVRPADFRRAIERSIANPDGYGPGFFSAILGAGACTKKRCDLRRGIVADDVSNTVTFHLSVSDPDLPYKLAHFTAFAVPANTPLKEQDHPLPATGPYMVKHYDAKHGVQLVRNPHFHEWSQAAQPNGYPDEIVWRFDGSKTAAAKQVRAVERGDADYAYEGVPAELISEVETRFADQVHVYPVFATSFIPLNTQLPPFDNLEARQALNYAVDRNLLASIPTPPGRVSCQVLPPGLFGYHRYCPYTIRSRSAGRYNGPDPAKAKRLVELSGTRGEAVSVWIYKSPQELRRGRYLVSLLRSLGYRARLKVVRDLVALFGAMDDTRRKVQMSIGTGFGADYQAPSDFFTPVLTCAAFHRWPRRNGNYAWFCDRHVDAEVARATALQLTDPQAAANLWARIDHEVVDLAPWVVTHNGRGIDFLSRRVGNYQYHPQWGVLLDQLWVK